MLVVIFRARIKQQNEDYSKTAACLREMALTEFGCLQFHSATEGCDEVALSHWPREECIRAWKAHPEHLAEQRLGKELWYESRTVEVATVTREYSSS